MNNYPDPDQYLFQNIIKTRERGSVPIRRNPIRRNPIR